MSLSFKILRRFAFYNSQISEKYGQKCCRYNQNSLPMPPETAKSTFNSIRDFLIGWNLNESCKALCRNYYFEDYPLAIQFLKEIAKIDALTTKNCPSFHVEKGELLKLELYSPSLAGLSQIDFELAMRINGLKSEEFGLIEITDLNNYKDEVKMLKFKRESAKIQKALKEDENIKLNQ